MDSYLNRRLIELLAMMKESNERAKASPDSYYALGYREQSDLMAILTLTDIISAAEKREAAEAEASQ